MKKILAAALSCTVLLSLSGCKGLDYGKNLQPSKTVQSYDAFLKPYYRAFLNEEQAALYDTIKLSLSNPGKKVAVPEGTDVDAIKKCLDYVWLDNPVFPQPSAYDIFLSNYDYIKTTYKKGFGKTDQKAAQALEKAREVAKLAPSGSDFEIVRFFHDYLVKNCSYNDEKPDEPDNSSAYGALVLGRATCEGYADAMGILLSLAGIENTYANNYGDRETGVVGHIWNIVKIDGGFYHIDVTSDDLAFADWERPDNQVLYWRFGLTTEEIMKTNSINDNILNLIPDCTQDTYNFYKYNGLLFDEYDKIPVAKAMAAFYTKSLQEGNSSTTVKFSNQRAFDEAVADIDRLCSRIVRYAGSESMTCDYRTGELYMTLEIRPEAAGTDPASQ